MKGAVMEFKAWDTFLNQGVLHIVKVSWNTVGWEAERAYTGVNSNPRVFEDLCDDQELDVIVYEQESKTFYSVLFPSVEAHRVLDESGLTDFWGHKGSEEQYANCFMVRNHAWSKESDFSFLTGTNDGWSWVISTNFTCVEVLTKEQPVIQVITENSMCS